MEKKRTYGVWAVRSSTSIFGPAQSWCKENGKPLEFDSKADAENYAKEANEHTTANVRYYVKEKNRNPVLFGKEHLNRSWMHAAMKK